MQDEEAEMRLELKLATRVDRYQHKVFRGKTLK